MYVVGSDKMLKEIHSSQLKNYFEAGTTLGQLVLANSGKTIFAGVAEADSPGPVRCYKFPLDGDFQEYQAHAAPCSEFVSHTTTLSSSALAKMAACTFSIFGKRTEWFRNV